MGSFMIAQVVFDLPLEGPFDYLVPPILENKIAVGASVQVLLGFKKRIGLVTALEDKSAFDNLKPVKVLVDKNPVLDRAQMDLAAEFSRYYGCSLGEALFSIVRGCGKQDIVGNVVRKNSLKTLHFVPSGNYSKALTSLIAPVAKEKQRTLILVPDQFIASRIEEILQQHALLEYCVVGNRSLVFRSWADIALTVMMDEDNPSFKQEQTPMYETRDVLLMRARREKMNVAFISTTPSVEMMDLVGKGDVHIKKYPTEDLVKPQAIDLNNYKTPSRWFLSPAVESSIRENLSQKKSSIVVVNHQQGVEELQKMLKSMFPLAKVRIFKRGLALLGGHDILIATSALLRFERQLQAGLVALLDIDGEFNRLDMRSCFRTWSLAWHLRSMAKAKFLIQTRQRDHYVIQSLMQDDADIFYHQDMSIRRELGLCPFGHQIAIELRSGAQKPVVQKAQKIYEALAQRKLSGELVEPSKDVLVHPPIEKTVTQKRVQYRLNILMQGQDVVAMIALIKETLAQTKRAGKVIITLNVDP